VIYGHSLGAAIAVNLQPGVPKAQHVIEIGRHVNGVAMQMDLISRIGGDQLAGWWLPSDAPKARTLLYHFRPLRSKPARLLPRVRFSRHFAAPLSGLKSSCERKALSGSVMLSNGTPKSPELASTLLLGW
jgi:hypothetical protein